MIQRVLWCVFVISTASGVFSMHHPSTASSSTSERACHLRPTFRLGFVADRRCTTGAVTEASKDEICLPGYATTHRSVSWATKLTVYDEYGITKRAPYGEPGSYEIDHLVPLELGGSNEIINLFPEPFPAYKRKDHMENFMHEQVCYNGLSLHSAQLFFMRKYVR